MYFNYRKLVISVFWVLVGGALIVLSLMHKINSDYWACLGGAFCAIGIMQIIRNFRYHKDAEYKEKIDIELTDERNRYIRMRSWSWSGYLFVIASAVASLVCYVSGYKEFGQLLSGCLCFVLFVYWLSYMIFKHKC